MCECRIDSLKAVSCYHCIVYYVHFGVIFKVLTYVFRKTKWHISWQSLGIFTHIQKYFVSTSSRELRNVCRWQHDVCHLGIYIQMLIPNFNILLLVGCFFGTEGVWCLNGLDNEDLSSDSHYHLSLMCTLKVVCWHFQLGTSKGLARHACCSCVTSLPRIMS